MLLTPLASGVMSPSHAMADSAPGSASQNAEGDESLPVDDEFQEARDGASQQLDGSVDREFPDSVPVDPPYFEAQQGGRSVMFGLSAEVAQYLDQGSGSDPSEGGSRGAPGLVPRAQTGEIAAKADSVSGSASGGIAASLLGTQVTGGLAHWKDDTEMMPDYESAFPSQQLPVGGRDAPSPDSQEASVALNYSLATTMQQFFQQQVSPMLEQVLLGQEIVMSRLDKLEQEQQAVSGHQRGGDGLMGQLQRLSLGRPAQSSGTEVGVTTSPPASSSLDVVMAEGLAVLEQHTSVIAGVDVQPSASEGFPASAEKELKDPNPKGSAFSHQESKTNPSRVGDGEPGRGVTMVEGVPYAWQMTPEGLKLQRLEAPKGSALDTRGRAPEVAQQKNVLGSRALSPFVATSAEVERMTPNIRRFHTTTPPRSRSSPKTRPGVLKKSPESSVASLQPSPSEPRRPVPVKPKIVYPCTPGGTEIKPPPHPSTAAEEPKVPSQLAVQGSGDLF